MFRKLLVGAILLTGLAFMVAVFPTLAAPTTTEQAQEMQTPAAFKAELTNIGLDSTDLSFASGRGFFVLNAAQDSLHYRIIGTRFNAMVTATIVSGDPVMGTVVETLAANVQLDEATDISGTLSVTDTFVTDLMAGNYSLVITPAGEPPAAIAGPVMFYTPEDTWNAVLLGENEVPPAMTEAVGYGVFTMNPDLSGMDYTIAVTDIVSITAAHLHPGWPGEVGPPVVPLYLPSDTRPFDPENPLTGTFTMTEEVLLDILSGHLYLNVHTVANPAGEIRGQFRSAYHTFFSDLQQPVPDSIDIGGYTMFLLDKDLSTVYWRTEVTGTITPTTATVYLADPGGDMPLFPLYDPDQDTLGVDDPVTGMAVLSSDDVLEMISENLYVSIDTEVVTNVLEGQILLVEPDQFYASTLEPVAGAEDEQMNGQVVIIPEPAENVTATEDAIFYLYPSLADLQYQLTITGLERVTDAYLFEGPPSDSNPRDVILYPEYVGDRRTFDPGNPIAGAVNLDPMDTLNLVTEWLYLNVSQEPFMLYMPIIFDNFLITATVE